MKDNPDAEERFATLGKNNSLIQFLSLCNFSNIANRDFENCVSFPLLFSPFTVSKYKKTEKL